MSRPKFVYVFDEDTREYLLGLGYTMLKEYGGVSVFVNSEKLTFSLPVKKYSLSDTLVL